MRKLFFAESYPSKASLGGKLSPKVTDEGRPGCPTGQEKHSVGATGGSPFSTSTRKGWVQDRPSSAPVCALGHLPKGKALGVGITLPVCKTTRPSPPSRWAGRYGRGIQGRRPGRKKRGPPQGPPPNQKRWVQEKIFFLGGLSLLLSN